MLYDDNRGYYYDSTIISEGSGTINVLGNIVSLTYHGESTVPERERYVTLSWAPANVTDSFENC